MSAQQTATRERQRTPSIRPTTGLRIADALWAALSPCLPDRRTTPRHGGGCPHVLDRRCADAMYILCAPALGLRKPAAASDSCILPVDGSLFEQQGYADRNV